MEYFIIARREDFKCYQYKEKVNVWGDWYSRYPDLIIVHYMHISKHHMYLIHIDNYYISVKFFKMTLF